MPTLNAPDYSVSSKRTYASSGTYYASLQGTLQTDPAREDAAIRQVRAGKLSDLRVAVIESGPTGINSSVTLLRRSAQGWQETNLSVTITGGPSYDHQVFQDSIPNDAVTFEIGDDLCWKIEANRDAIRWLSLRSICVRAEDQ